jgi:hypothetical protein
MIRGWENRDLPVLRAIVDEFEDGEADCVTVEEIMARTGFDRPTVGRSIQALEGGQPTFVETDWGFGDYNVTVNRVTERARRAVGDWPTPEDLADRFIAAYQRAAYSAETDEQRNAMRRVASIVGETGRGLLVEVMARVLTGQG